MKIKQVSLGKSLILIVSITLMNLLHINDASAALAWFSRANCATMNESITWDPFASYWLWTYTGHYKNGVLQHGWNTGWALTWRSYAGHSDGDYSGWYVWGEHYRLNATKMIHLGSTDAVDCNLSSW
jgi:hypothetical protein